MKKSFTLCLLLVLITASFSEDYWWSKTYGGPKYERGPQLLESSDGFLFLVGRTTSFGAGDPDFWLQKLDQSGDTLWSKTYGGASIEMSHHLLESSDGSLFLVGSSYFLGAGVSDIWLQKLDQNGDTLWSKTYGSTSYDENPQLLESSDGSLFSAGCTSKYSVGEVDLWLQKLGPQGLPLWSKTYGSSTSGVPPQLLESSDGSLFLVGSTSSYVAGTLLARSCDLWLQKLDQNGDIIWSKTYGGEGGEFSPQLVESDDGSLYLVAISKQLAPFGQGATHLWLQKLDETGSTIWSKTYGEGNEHSPHLLKSSDGTLLLVATTSSFSADGNDLWLQKLDENGDNLWSKTYGGTENESSPQLLERKDGTVLLVGVTSSYGAGGEDIWINSLPPVQYSNETTPLEFRISEDSEDSLTTEFTLLEFPEGMTISEGGTVSWSPLYDTIALEHVRFTRQKEGGDVDTLWFDVWANREDISTPIADNGNSIKTQSVNDLNITMSNNVVHITSASSINTVELFDLRGRLIHSQRVSGSVKSFNWNSSSVATGSYIMSVSTDIQSSNRRIIVR